MVAFFSSMREAFINLLNNISMVGIADIADIIIVAIFIYYLVSLIRRTSSSKVAKGLVVLLLAFWLSGQLKLNSVNFILRTTMEMGLLALVILFQPELRRILEKVGSSRFSGLLGREISLRSMDKVITQTVLACNDMSRSKTGALIIFERDNPLIDAMNTGTHIDADVTSELMKNIFYNKAPLHDGAMIIKDGRIAAAGCMLPLSQNTNLSKDLGMRHRAGIGMSEHSDAVVAIVSEETGAISVAVGGMLKRHLQKDTFEKILRNELIIEEDNDKKSRGLFKRRAKVKDDEKTKRTR